MISRITSELPSSHLGTAPLVVLDHQCLECSSKSIPEERRANNCSITDTESILLKEAEHFTPCISWHSIQNQRASALSCASIKTWVHWFRLWVHANWRTKTFTRSCWLSCNSRALHTKKAPLRFWREALPIIYYSYTCRTLFALEALSSIIQNHVSIDLCAALDFRNSPNSPSWKLTVMGKT